jgi:hypothetical protein
LNVVCATVFHLDTQRTTTSSPASYRSRGCRAQAERPSRTPWQRAVEQVGTETVAQNAPLAVVWELPAGWVVERRPKGTYEVVQPPVSSMSGSAKPTDKQAAAAEKLSDRREQQFAVGLAWMLENEKVCAPIVPNK